MSNQEPHQVDFVIKTTSYTVPRLSPKRDDVCDTSITSNYKAPRRSYQGFHSFATKTLEITDLSISFHRKVDNVSECTFADILNTAIHVFCFSSRNHYNNSQVQNNKICQSANHETSKLTIGYRFLAPVQWFGPNFGISGSQLNGFLYEWFGCLNRDSGELRRILVQIWNLWKLSGHIASFRSCSDFRAEIWFVALNREISS